MGFFKKRIEKNENGFLNIEIQDLIDWNEPNIENHHIFAINTLCNFDRDVIPYLHAPVGSTFIRTKNGTFIKDDGKASIHIEKQDR